MKKNKVIISIIIFFIAVFLMAINNTSYAVEPDYLVISKERTVHFDTVDVTYKHQLNRDTVDTTENIWNIVTCEQSGVVTDQIPDLYCLRAGLGFARQENAVSPAAIASQFKTVQYNLKKDMVSEYSSIQSLLNNSQVTIFKNEKKQNYNRLLWVLDNMLLENATKEELIQYLKDYAKYPEKDFTSDNAQSRRISNKSRYRCYSAIGNMVFYK